MFWAAKIFSYAAKYFSFVRTNNITVNKLTTVVSDGTWSDGTYAYLDITTLNTNTSGYPTYPELTKGDRVRVVGVSGSTVSAVFDYPILGLITDKPVGSGFPTTGFFLKLQYDAPNMVGWNGLVTLKIYSEIYWFLSIIFTRWTWIVVLCSCFLIDSFTILRVLILSRILL